MTARAEEHRDDACRSGARTACTPSRRPSASSSPAGRSSSTGRAPASRARSRACASASSRAPSAPTRRPTPSSSASPASASASSPPRPRRRSSSATGTPSCSPRSRSSPRRSTSSRSRSATSRAPRCRGAGAVRQGPEGLVGDAAQAQPGRRRAHLRARARRPRPRARRPRERRALARARHLALVGRAGRHPRRVPRARLHARPLHLADRRPRRPRRADAPQPRGEPRPLLQPARPARARRVGPLARRCVPPRAAQRDARVGRGARLPRARRAPTTRSPAGSTSTPSSTSARTHVTSTPSSTACTHSPRRRNPFMSEAATHVASGKVRELYALDDDRLLLVASDRISTFDVVLPTEIPDKGRVLTGLSGFWFALLRGIVPNHLLALRDDGRSTECRRLEMLPIECVVRGYLAGSGWKDYQATGAISGHALPEGLAGVRPAAGADLHAGDEGADRRPRREHHARAGGRARRRRTVRGGRAHRDRALPRRRGARARVRDHHRRHEVRARRRREGQPRARRRGAHARLVALLAGRRVRAGRGQDSFDKQFVRDYCETLDWDKTAPGPELPDEVVAGHAREVRRGVRAADRRSRSTAYVDDPTVVLG